jgi:small-conductance mechanosensitive channel
MTVEQILAALSPSVVWVIGLVLVAVAAAHVTARVSLRRRAARDAAESAAAGERGGRGWVGYALQRTIGPLLLLVWVHGAYVVLRLMVGQLAAEAGGVRLAIDWSYGLAVTAGLFWLLARAGAVAEHVLRAVSRTSESDWDDLALPLLGTAIRYLLPLVALLVGATIVRLSPDQERALQNILTLALIGLVAWTLVQLVNAAVRVLLARHRIDAGDNLRARAVHTQIMVLRKIAHAVIAIFTLASMLMVFDSVRQFGASILASAGIAGIVVGLAAQRSLATLLAGFQIALTQPIRVDDVVIVEDEWGRIEDITLTYVVVRVWDLRRLIVPITYFIEQPFQNWTRTSADILGTVTIPVDYSAPIEALRRELTRILESSSRWDGKVNVLQVTAATDRTLEVRALASARDASLAWDLRCEVREKLVDFLQRNHPDCLPKTRATVETAAGASAA